MSNNTQFSKIEFDTDQITWYQNTSQDIIAITEDKLRLILNDYEKDAKIKVDWFTPLGLSLTILATLLTTDFHEFVGLSKDVWNAMFIFLFILSCLFSLYRVVSCIKKKMTINDVIERAKASKK